MAVVAAVAEETGSQTGKVMYAACWSAERRIAEEEVAHKDCMRSEVAAQKAELENTAAATAAVCSTVNQQKEPYWCAHLDTAKGAAASSLECTQNMTLKWAEEGDALLTSVAEAVVEATQKIPTNGRYPADTTRRHRYDSNPHPEAVQRRSPAKRPQCEIERRTKLAKKAPKTGSTNLGAATSLWSDSTAAQAQSRKATEEWLAAAAERIACAQRQSANAQEPCRFVCARRRGPRPP